MTNEYTIQLLISAYLCVLLSRGASDPSQASVIKKSLRSLRTLRAKTKHPCGGYMSHAKDAESAEF